MGHTRIPVDVSFEHYLAVRSILQHALHDIESNTGREPKWITCRLNQSGTTATDDAYFLGWLENQSLRDARIRLNKPDPGLFRFLDPVHGDTYRTALKNPTQVLSQAWRQGRGLGGAPRQAPLKLFLKDGFYQLETGWEICRRSIAIKADHRYVGTLNMGFSTDPGNALDDPLKAWSQDPASELVQYVKNEFNPGGPADDASSKKADSPRAGRNR